MPKAPDFSGSNIRLLKQLVRLQERKEALEDALEDVKSALEHAQERAIIWMQRENVPSIHVDGRVVFATREIWASATDIETIEEAEDGKYAFLVKKKVNTNTLSAWVRKDLEKNQEDDPIIPPSVADAIKVTNKVKAVARKSKRRLP